MNQTTNGILELCIVFLARDQVASTVTNLASNRTLCATTRAIRILPEKTAYVSSRTTCPVRRTTSVALAVHSRMSRTYMAPLSIPRSLTLIAPHGNPQMFPWNFRDIMQGSAASNFKMIKIKVNPSVQQQHRPRRRPYPHLSRPQHRFLLRFPSSSLSCLQYRRHLLTTRGHSAVSMQFSRSPSCSTPQDTRSHNISVFDLQCPQTKKESPILNPPNTTFREFP